MRRNLGAAPPLEAWEPAPLPHGMGSGWGDLEVGIRVPSRRQRRLRHLARRWLAAGCLGMAAWAGLTAVAPPPPVVDEAPVLVLIRDLPGGSVLNSSDLQIATRPRQWMPPTAISEMGVAVGRRLAAPVAAGEPLTQLRLLGPSLLHGQPEDYVLVSVPVADAGLSGVLRAGDRVRVLQPGTGSPVATGVVVAPISTAPPGPLGVGETATPLLLAMPGTGAAAVAAGSAGDAAGVSSGSFVVVLLP